ncbi:MAG: ABC transporter ATP-binding protein [Ruminococcaceae bacterium]|nr:ABC transporter ATP-binding protein [Oscillospiraceae bacterium]
MADTSSKQKRNKYDVDESLDSPFSIKHFSKSVKYIKRHSKQLVLALIFSVIAILAGLTFPSMLRIITDKFVPEKNILGIIITGIVGYLLVLTIAFAESKRAKISAKTGQQIVSEIRHDLFMHLQKLPFDYYDSRPHGKILVRVVNYVNSVADFFANGLINIILELLSLVFILFFMFFTNVRLSLIVLVGLVPFATYIILVKNVQRKTSRTFSNKNSNLNAYYQESIDGMRVTQSFDREEKNYSIAYKMAKECAKWFVRRSLIVHTMFPAAIIISAFSTAAVYLIGVSLGESISIGVIIAMGSYCGRFWEPIQNLGNLYNSVIDTAAYLERIFEVMDVEPAISDVEGAYELEDIKGEVKFEHVFFEYEKNVPILKDVTFRAKPGESIALVGPTGAGKTTVVNLLARFYDIKSGSITIDGHSIHDVTLTSLRKQMGIMLQDTFIFTGTIMENIKYGRLDASDEEAINAAKIVSAHDFIMSLPNGYETVVTERGGSLSAGQRQLISFARTLLANPKVLILDEATSAIDTKTELLVQKGLQSLLKGRTSFIIAHRLSTIKNCDRILYIDQKNIAEAGNHEQLLQAHGLYYSLYTSQLTE